MSEWTPTDDLVYGRDYFHCSVCMKDCLNREMSEKEDVCKDCYDNRDDKNDREG